MKLLPLSLALNLAALSVAGVALHHKGGLPWLISKFSHPVPVQDNRLSVFDALPITPEDTVFIGDSILALGEWSELMNDVHCKNRAVSGSTTADVLARLQPIIDGKPRRIVMLVGINDIQSGVPRAMTIENYRTIIKRVHDGSPATKMVLVPVLGVNDTIYRKVISPIHPEIHIPTGDEVEWLDQWLFTLGIEDHFPGMIFPNILWDHSTGNLQPEFTNDGLHLNGRGLVELAKLLKE